ncbi:hypothetical protein LY78DRAFT_346892 [Colletotrichum sublineola]|nr:hypothetical protein LY78DRAFT_346892 [Colletotrichum sublineola]
MPLSCLLSSPVHACCSLAPSGPIPWPRLAAATRVWVDMGGGYGHGDMGDHWPGSMRIGSSMGRGGGNKGGLAARIKASGFSGLKHFDEGTIVTNVGVCAMWEARGSRLGLSNPILDPEMCVQVRGITAAISRDHEGPKESLNVMSQSCVIDGGPHRGVNSVSGY